MTNPFNLETLMSDGAAVVVCPVCFDKLDSKCCLYPSFLGSRPCAVCGVLVEKEDHRYTYGRVARKLREAQS